MSSSLAALAARLVLAAPSRPGGILAVLRSERRAGELARLVEALVPDRPAILMPPWDCLPFDRSPPSAEAMGGRIATLRRMAEGAGRAPVVVSTPDALMQRLPPPEALSAVRRIAVGDPVDPVALAAGLLRAGYVEDARIDEPGEFAARGQVFEIYAAGTGIPVRLDLEDGRVKAIRLFDPATQRSRGDCAEVVVDPASEIVDLDPAERTDGIEHGLAGHHPRLTTAADWLPDAAVLLDEGAEERADAVLATITESHADRLRWSRDDAGARRPPADPAALYLTAEEWRALLARPRLEPPAGTGRDGFDLAGTGRPWRGLATLLRRERDAGRRILLAAAHPADLARLTAAAGRALETEVGRFEGLTELLASPPGTVAALEAPADGGFSDAEAGLTLVVAADVLGTRARPADGEAHEPAAFLRTEETPAVGDVVVHLDHGLGILEGLETVESPDLGRRETLRIGYAGRGVLLAPVEEIDRIWRYGSDPEAVTLDRLGGEGWDKRRRRVEAEIAETARAMLDLAAARKAAREAARRAARPADRSLAIEPPATAFEAVARRFPYPPTPDQARAVDAVLADLSSGEPMDRLVVGDVGYGKTEVALRAAAAVALAGRQVAIAAPTTVLVRQHLATVGRRFADLGLSIGHLSRLVSPTEARRVREGLASGEIRIVVGTQALAAETVRFADLGLLVIDEEQRFGTAQKRRLRDKAGGGHVLTLTATPIPRTLQSALVGLQDLSVMETPPARRRPVRTFAIPPDMATVRQALLRERRRGGQSFVVVPRIEDIDGILARLRAAVPDLALIVAHGRMRPAEVDEAMVRFADGEGDVLVATSLIETGLDVPRANTMVVWSAELFGLADLHQLRGRVGRGRAQAVCYLLSETTDALALRRLGTLASLDRLGAGLEISARDLDARGAGDLVGEAQAGHLKLVGPGLARRLLERALAAARGEPAEDGVAVVVNLGLPEILPDSYVPEPDLRIALYARLAESRDAVALDGLADELEDRFGPPPAEVDGLIRLARLRLSAASLGIGRIDGGPNAVALTLEPDGPAALAAAGLADGDDELSLKEDRLVLKTPTATPEERLALAEALVARLA
jgi:transcription-repair coupling factor (superfamily II helicase)